VSALSRTLVSFSEMPYPPSASIEHQLALYMHDDDRMADLAVTTDGV
jgi:hypothetical protein